MIADWYRVRRQCIELDPNCPDDVRAARLFFLELDRVSNLAHIHDTLADELCEIGIKRRRFHVECLLARFQQRLSFRLHGIDAPELLVDIDQDALRHLDAVLGHPIRQFLCDAGDKVNFLRSFRAFMLFASGALNDRYSTSGCGPDSAYIFFFAEFAFAAIESHVPNALIWQSLLPIVVAAPGVYARAYGPKPRPIEAFGSTPRLVVPMHEWPDLEFLAGKPNSELRDEFNQIVRRTFIAS